MYLYRISRKLKNILFIPMLLEVLFMAFVITLCMFEAVVLEDFTRSMLIIRVNLLACVITEIFMFCHGGQLIQNESLLVRDRMYNSNWYHLFGTSRSSNDLMELKSLINMTSMRSDDSITISAGGFISITYETFFSVSWL